MFKRNQSNLSEVRTLLRIKMKKKLFTLYIIFFFYDIGLYFSTPFEVRSEIVHSQFLRAMPGSGFYIYINFKLGNYDSEKVAKKVKEKEIIT